MRMAKLIAEYPKTTFWAVLLLVAACVPLLFKIKADTSISSFLPRGHVSYQQKLDIQRIYHINDPIFVDVYDRKTGDIFTPEGLQAVRKLSRILEDLKGIRPGSVRSLDTFEDIRGTAGGFDVNGFLEPMPATLEQAQAVRERAKSFRFFDGLIVSEDGKQAGLIGDFEDNADVLYVFGELDKLREKMDHEGDIGIRLSGPPIVTGTLNVYLNRDALKIDPIAAVLTSLLLFLSLRSWAGVLLPLLVMVPAIAFAAVSMPLFGYDFTPYSNAVPVVVLSTSIGDSVHFLTNYYDLRLQQPGMSAKQAVVQTLKEIWQPIVATSVTTTAGFLMLLKGSPMMPVHHFGVTVAVGVMSAMVLSLTILPASVVMFAPKPTESFARLYAARNGGLPSRWDRLSGWLSGRVVNRLGVTLGFLLAVAGLGYAGLSMLFPDYDPVKFFPKDSHVYQDFYAIRDKYLGLNFIEVDINTGKEDGIYSPDFLQRLEKLQERIEVWPPVGGTISIADYLKKMNQAFNTDQPEFYKIPDNPDANAQFFMLYNISGDPRRFDEVADSNRKRANLRIFLKAGNYHENGDFIRWLEKEAPKSFPNAKVTLGGETYVVYNWMHGVERDVLKSVMLSGLTMFTVGLIFLRSFVGALLLLLPDFIGLVLTYAFIGVTGVAVGLGTSVFASIALGVGIDFAIHYLWRYRDERRAGLDHGAATVHVMQDVGKSILFNGAIIIGGFLILLLSTTSPAQHTGEYVAISVGASLLTTFLVLTTATRWWKVAR